MDDAVQAAEEIFRALHGLVRVVQACDIGLEIGGPLSQGLQARRRPLARFRPSDQEHPGVEGVDEEGGEDRSQPTGAAADQVYATRFEGGSIIDSGGQGFEPGLLADAVPIAHLHRLVREFVEQPIDRDRTLGGEGLQQYPGVFLTQASGIGGDGVERRISGRMQIEKGHGSRAVPVRECPDQTVKTEDSGLQRPIRIGLDARPVMDDRVETQIVHEPFVIVRSIRAQADRIVRDRVVVPGDRTSHPEAGPVEFALQARVRVHQQQGSREARFWNSRRGRSPHRAGEEQPALVRAETPHGEPLQPRQDFTVRRGQGDLIASDGAGIPLDSTMGQAGCRQGAPTDQLAELERNLHDAVAGTDDRQALQGSIEQCRMQPIAALPDRGCGQFGPAFGLAVRQGPDDLEPRTILESA